MRCVSDDVAFSMPVLESNACSCVKFLGVVGCTCSAIVPAGAPRVEESGQMCDGVSKPSALAPEYQGDNL